MVIIKEYNSKLAVINHQLTINFYYSKFHKNTLHCYSVLNFKHTALLRNITCLNVSHLNRQTVQKQFLNTESNDVYKMIKIIQLQGIMMHNENTKKQEHYTINNY